MLTKCTLQPSDSLATEGILPWIMSLKKSLHQSLLHICKSQVLGKKQASDGNSLLLEANGQPMEQACHQDMWVTKV